MKKDEKVFNDLYKQLNTSQKKAVDTVEGPVMVIAGPGTGKTTILTLRIANILRVTDATPGSILALTFTESGVRAMRQKLLKIIGADAHKVGIYTFHSFCNDIIKEYPEEFPEIIGSTNATDVDQIKIIETIIDANSFEYIKPYGDQYYYVNALLSQIRDTKREGYTPEEYKKLLGERTKAFKNIDDLYHEKGRYKGEMKGAYRSQEKLLSRDAEFLTVFTEYQKKLREQKQIDFEDMIVETVKVLEGNKDLLLTLQEKYQYVLADEHQDANRAQNQILELLANFHESPNLFVVGDEKQAIFRFQGASLENFLYFERLYEDTTLIHLEDNYRSTQSILDNAHELIGNNAVEESLRQKLKSNTKAPVKPILIYSFEKEYEEIQFILKDVKEKIDSGISPDEIAIIYRNNKDSFELVRNLEKTDIPFTIFSDQDVLDHVDIRRFLKILRTIHTLSDDVHIAEAMHISYLNIAPYDIYTIVDHAKSTKRKIIDVIINDAEKLGLKSITEVKRFGELLEKWSKDAHNTDVLSLTEDIINASGYLEDILNKPATYERLNILDTFFAEMKSVAANHTTFTLKDFLDHISILEDYKIAIRSKNLTSRTGIKLMTAHRSKGLEYEHVYIFDAIQKKWGGSARRRLFTPVVDGDETNQEDERRLFYVALTRAKHDVVITYADTKDDGTEALPTQFIAELDKNIVDVKQGEAVDIKEIYTKPPVKDTLPSLHDKEYLNKRFLEQPFSVTALNNYLSCPWQYFYTNLVRLPKTYTKPQVYGVVVHNTLKDLFDSVKDKKMNRAEFMATFNTYLSKQLLDESTENELKNKGETSLGGYFDFYYESLQAPLETEFQVFTDFKINDGETIHLTGNLDKIEKGSGDDVTVVDYKTSKIKTKNVILGKTKDSNGDIFRQLVFYKLLLETADTPYKMKHGVIDFIEPDDKGNYKKEILEVTQDDVKELTDTIKKVSDEILSLSFWNSHCDNSECQYCKLHKTTQ